jgi:DNA-binding response OmpR family regulator
VLRRTRKTGASAAGADGPHRVGELEVDPVRHEVRLNGATVETTPAEFRILAALIAEPGRAFSRAQLLTEAFGFDHYALDRTVDVHVMNLRRKIEQKANDPRYLLTVYGVGYKMADDAS